MARRSNVTISRGLDARYWLTSAGYVAVGILLALLTLVTVLQTRGSANYNAIVGSSIAIYLFVYSLAGLLTYPAIFKDASYLRTNRGYWNPKWWQYIGAGLGIPVLIVVGSSVFQAATLGGVFAIIVHALSAAVVNALYLYRRHDIVGVP